MLTAYHAQRSYLIPLYTMNIQIIVNILHNLNYDNDIQIIVINSIILKIDKYIDQISSVTFFIHKYEIHSFHYYNKQFILDKM